MLGDYPEKGKTYPVQLRLISVCQTIISPVNLARLTLFKPSNYHLVFVIYLCPVAITDSPQLAGTIGIVGKPTATRIGIPKSKANPTRE